ncbi:MAG: DNA gyrase subunit A [Candidatus Omnitrophica bacterium]|nr:DNA gyrase subunit A [Candidatus Omnitrophota bacterium]
MYTRNEKIINRYIEEEIKDSYLNYAMSVIVGRALPDVRDGLKPVQRRILYTMKELNLEHNKPYKKCARIVGDCLGRYHPHGDMAVYDALVRLAQEFSMRYPLVEGQGNFGSIDGDAPAAMRYTEARLSAIAEEMLIDIEKETVDLISNFDNSLKEPCILPALLPNLLINGASGIAVGMATNMPPHNLKEVIEGIIYYLDHPNCEIKDLMHYIKGPDFPTGGLICGTDGIKEAYTTGKGKVILRARVSVEHQKQGKDLVVITEIPYQTSKANIIETIADLVETKKIEGISDIRDESDKEGLRIVVELKRDIEPQIVINQLFKHTQLEITFGIINLALVNGRPRILNLKQLIENYVLHRKEVIRRRTQFDLEKAKYRAHILEGLKICLKFLDRIIKLIKASKDTEIAKLALMKNFSLTEIQAKAILEMQLQRLTALERGKIDSEYLDLIKKIELYQSILASEKRIEEIIKEELRQLKGKYADERLTEISGKVEDIEIEDLIAEEDVVVTMSHGGYIKRCPVSAYRRQRRGGKGVTAAEVKEEDFIEHLFVASTKDYLLIFTNRGRLYWLKVYEIPQGGRTARGKAIVNLIAISSEEKVSATIPVKEFSPDRFLVMITRQGLIKKTNLEEFSNPRRSGIIALTLEKEDQLIGVELTDGTQDILVASMQGKAIRFPEVQIRPMGRNAKGIKAINLARNDQVIGMEVVKKDRDILTISELGFAKRTSATEYRLQRRAGKGIINMKITSKNGKVVGIKAVSDADEIMVITQKGIFLRCLVKDIRRTGRSAQGVRLIKLEEKDRIASVAHVIREEE